MHGVWAYPDACAGHSIREDDIAAALRFYLDDELDCSVQSLNKDVVQSLINSVREAKGRRFTTKLVRETYTQFRRPYPHIKIVPTKSYALQPKWVCITPHRDECVCIICANFELLVTATLRL